MRLESINTNQVARVSKATICSELSSMRWHTEVPAGRKKARETPHTLHERRPQEDKENQRKSCIDYVPPTKPLPLGKDNGGQANHKAEQLVKNAMVSEVIKKDWVKLIQAEDILASDAKAFIPRVQEEETNPTFEHPEEWKCLMLQEKAHLILTDQAVKLMRHLCQEGDTRPPESENCTGQMSIMPHIT